jgi:Putative Actinobacterial Holin-X, holin superfamily III
MRPSLEAVRRLVRHLGLLLLLRADLAAEELSLSLRQWLTWLGMALATFALLLVTLIAAGAWLTLLLWDRFGAATPGVLALLFGIAGVLLLRGLVNAATVSPAVLSRTRAALREDYDALSAAVAPARDAGPGE